MPGTTTLALSKKTDEVEQYLASMRFSQSLDALDALEVELAATNDTELATVLGFAKVGGDYSYKWGKSKASGDIVSVNIRRRGYGGWTVNVVGLEKLHRLRHLRLSEVKEQTKDAIASTLIAKAGVSASATKSKATAAEEVLIDDAMLATLKQLADEMNFALRAEDSKLYFEPRNLPAKSTLTLSWLDQVQDVDLTHDLTEVVTAVKVTGWDYLKCKAVEYETKATDLKKISGGTVTAISLRSKLAAVAVIRADGVTSPILSQVKERAIGELQRRAETLVRGTFSCDGLLAANVSQKLTVKDAPWPMGGPFLISGVEHIVSGNNHYETRLSVFSDGLPKP